MPRKRQSPDLNSQNLDLEVAALRAMLAGMPARTAPAPPMVPTQPEPMQGADDDVVPNHES
jgi:hypothetical protein